MCSGEQSLDATEDCRGSTSLFTEPMLSLTGLPIFIFSFTCHQNSVTVTNELQRATPLRSIVCVVLAILMGLGLYLFVGFCGYST